MGLHYIVRGNAKDIVEFISSNPRAYEVELSKCGNRLAKDCKFFDNLTAVLKERGIYDECVWKYALVSDKGGAELSEYLSQRNEVEFEMTVFLEIFVLDRFQLISNLYNSTVNGTCTIFVQWTTLVH